MSALFEWRRLGKGRHGLLAVTAAVIAGALLAPAASAEVEPGRNLELNHSIEMGVLENWPAGNVLVEIYRGASIHPTTHVVSGGVLIASHEASFSGPGETYDINHVGPPDCWVTTGGGTPDVKPGDLMVATVLDGPGGNPTSDIDYVFVRNVFFTENADGEITGHARGVETGGVFDVEAPISPAELEAGGVGMEAKRVGAPEEGEHGFVAEDVAADGTFTDVLIPGTPLGGELFIDTVDSAGGGTGITVTFPGPDAGGNVGCGPMETTSLSSNSHPVINQANQNTDMVVGGPRQPAVTVTADFGGVPLTVVNDDVNGTWSATIPASVLQGLADGSTTPLVVHFSDLSPNQTVNVLKDVTAPDLSATPGSGTYVGNQSVVLASNGGEDVRFTLDGSVPGSSSRLYDGAPIELGPGNHTIRAFSVDAAGNRRDETFQYAVSAPQGAGGAGVGAGAGGGGGAATGGGPVVLPDPLATFRVRTLRAPGRLSLRTARRRGITARFIAPEGTQAVRASLYLNTNASSHRTRRLVKRLTTDATGGRMSVRFADRRTRRKLRKGVYTISVAPSSDGTTFAEGTAKRFRIR